MDKWKLHYFKSGSLEFRDWSEIKDKTIYMVLAQDGHKGVFRCPNPKCKDHLMSINLPEKSKNFHKLIKHADGSFTIIGSVHAVKTCGAHFFIENGRERWA